MILKRIARLGLAVALAMGVAVVSTGGASAATATAATTHASLAAERTVVVTLEGQPILLRAGDLQEMLGGASTPMQNATGTPMGLAQMQLANVAATQTLIRAMWVNPITVAKCILEIGSFIFGSGGKLAYIGVKIMKVVNKSAKLKALLKKVGGVKAALKGLWDKLKHKKMSAKHRADVDGFWKGLAKQAGSIAGIGNCLSLF